MQSALLDHTNGAATGYAERLNGTANEKYGLAKSVSVMPGDTVKMEVFAKYLDPNTANWPQALTNLATAITNNTGGIVVDGTNYAGSTASFSYAGLVNTSSSSGTGPKAYLNWILFDRDYNFTDGGYVRMTTAARETGQDVAHELLSAQVSITKPGYLYIYLSNESETQVEVFFDDFKVEHVQGPVVQMDDYYPFGLTFNSFSRENATPQAYKFNGKEAQTALDLGWLDYGARMYDGAVGRWMVIDPLTPTMPDHSPYCYAFNNPVKYVDLFGLLPGDIIRPGAEPGVEVDRQQDKSDWEYKRNTTYEEFKKTLPPNRIATCPTCPADKEYDPYRNSSSAFAYEEGVGVYNDVNVEITAQQDGPGDPNNPFDVTGIAAREPYGVLKYIFFGGLENGVWYNRDGTPRMKGCVTGTPPSWVAGPAGGLKTAGKGLQLLVQQGGVWRHAINGRVASKQTLKAAGLLGPKTVPSVGKAVVPEFIEKAEQELQKVQNPGFWNKVKGFLYHSAQFFGG